MKKSSKQATPRPYPTAEEKDEALSHVAESVATYSVVTPTSTSLQKPRRVEEKRIAGHAVSDEVWQFAVANDLIPHLETAVRLVRECFPTVSDIQLLYEIDWDVENRSYIVIEIKITGSIPSLLEQYDRFTTQMVRQVPPEKGEKIILSICGVADGIQIARYLNELHHQRILADYDLKSDQFAAQFKVAFWIAKAEQAILTLNTLSASQNICTQIRNGIRAYEEKLKAYQGAMK